MLGSTWPTVAIAWSFPICAFAQAPSPQAQIAADPINQAAESPGGQPSTLTGNWGGLRTLLSDEGIDIKSGYRNEAVTNVLGGPRASAAQAGQINLAVAIDMQKLFGWTGGTLQTAMTYREGDLLPVNLLQQPQEIFGRGDIARLVELSYEQKLFDNVLTVKFGRLPEGEFNDFGCDFANLTFLRPTGRQHRRQLLVQCTDCAVGGLGPHRCGQCRLPRRRLRDESA